MYNSLGLGEFCVVERPAYTKLPLGTSLVFAKPSREERKKAKAKELKKAEEIKKSSSSDLVKNPNPEGRQEMVTKDYAEQYEREHGKKNLPKEDEKPTAYEEDDLDKYLGKPGEPEPEPEEPEEGSPEAESFEYDKKITRKERKEYNQYAKEDTEDEETKKSTEPEKPVEKPTEKPVETKEPGPATYEEIDDEEFDDLEPAPRPEKKLPIPEEHKKAAEKFVKSEEFKNLKEADQKSIQDFISRPTLESAEKIKKLLESQSPKKDTKDGWQSDDFSMHELTDTDDEKTNFFESLKEMYDEFKSKLDY